MSRIRTFVAVDVDAEVRRRASQLIDTLSDIAPSVRWVTPENLHVTLKFLGDAPDSEIYEICRRVSKVASRHVAFSPRFVGVGAFPSPERPRTIWIGIDEGAAALEALHTEIDETLGDLGYPLEPRAYRAHLTIGRVSQRHRQTGALREQILHRENQEFGRTTALECLVMASEITSEGPRYSVMGRGSLRNPTVSD